MVTNVLYGYNSLQYASQVTVTYHLTVTVMCRVTLTSDCYM